MAGIFNNYRLCFESILLAIVTIATIAITILFTFILFPFLYFKQKAFDKKYAEYIVANNGKNFFCYNNKKKSQTYIEKEIIPNLNQGIEIIFLNGKALEVESDKEFISAALYRLQHYNKFPHMMKIRNGKLIDASLNNLFYRVLNMNTPKVELLQRVNAFFEITD